jgi:nitrous oxidase accessory protein NosD
MRHIHQQQIAKKFVALTFIFLMALCTISIQVGNSSKTIVVPDNYPTISAAVNSASPGDTILVKSGVYYENLLINKSLTLIGEDSQTTIVIGTGGIERGQSTVFTLAADQVEISGFTIESLNYSTSSYCATGICVEGDGCSIIGNNIRNTYYGVFCSVQSLTTISGNNITANFKDGIRFCGGSLNKISENNITGNAKSGIAIEGYSNTISRNVFKNNNIGIGVGFSYSLVFGNTLTGNSEAGLYFAGFNNTVCANAIGSSKWGIYFTPYFAAPNGNKFYHNNFVNNDGDVGGSSAYNVQFWDNGGEGNYWSDYKEVYPNAAESDASGIGDVPYVVGANNTDNYPLLSPFEVLNAGDAPSFAQPLTAKSNGDVALWPFDVVEPNGVTPDETGLNPAVVGSIVGNVSFTPVLVDGESGKALSFDGAAYVSVPMSPSLEIAGESTIDVWINVQEFKDVEYNNIVVECVRSRASLPERTFGLAVNGYTSDGGAGVPLGALRAYVSTEEEGLNEIVTTEPVVSLGQWMHVVFTRSLATGMHIYVNGEEQNVTVVSGVRDPKGLIRRETELYVGHDAVCFVDEAGIYNVAVEPSAGQFLWVLWLLSAAVVAAGLGAGLFFYYRKHKR